MRAATSTTMGGRPLAEDGVAGAHGAVDSLIAGAGPRHPLGGEYIALSAARRPAPEVSRVGRSGRAIGDRVLRACHDSSSGGPDARGLDRTSRPRAPGPGRGSCRATMRARVPGHLRARLVELGYRPIETATTSARDARQAGAYMCCPTPACRPRAPSVRTRADANVARTCFPTRAAQAVWSHDSPCTAASSKKGCLVHDSEGCSRSSPSCPSPRDARDRDRAGRRLQYCSYYSYMDDAASHSLHFSSASPPVPGALRGDELP